MTPVPETSADITLLAPAQPNFPGTNSERGLQGGLPDRANRSRSAKRWRWMLLALALGLGLGGRPVWATGGIIYPLGGYHGMGQYQLQVIGPSVLLNLTARNAPARQYQTGQKPTVLFHLSETWWPAAPVTWEVEGWPVLSDGTPDPQRTGPHVFTLQVDTQGVVRYLDSDQLGTAEFVRYRTTLAWPVPGTKPQVCARSDEVRAAILEALTPAEGSRPQCGAVTWNQLAAIRTLGQPEQPDRDPLRVIHAHDLAGLYGLEEAALFFGGTRWQPELLAHVPRLRHLWLETTFLLEQLPDGALNAVPLPTLTHLTVVGESLQTLPVDWLRHLPGLTYLHLDLYRLPELPPDLLTHLPSLTHLHLDLSHLRELPPDWLPALVSLTHLTLEFHSLDFLPHPESEILPALTHLEVVGEHLDYLPTAWLWSAPALTSLQLRAPLRQTDYVAPPALPELTHLQMYTSTRRLRRLLWTTPAESEWLSQLSALTHLDLGYNRPRFPWGSLPPLPTLTHLTVTSDEWDDGQDPSVIPALPTLTHLSLDLGNQTNPPPDFLPPLPALTHLQVHMGHLENLDPDWRPDWPWLPALTHLELVLPPLEHMPNGWLPSLSTLTHLTLDTPLDNLPANWLPDLPNLTHLTLDAGGRQARYNRSRSLKESHHLDRILSREDLGTFIALPPKFLVSVPALKHLTLYADGLATWPDDLLHPVPGLTHLTLDVRGLAELPSDILVPVPYLTHLTLYADRVTTWPDGLLHPVSGLTHLTLDVRGLAELPSDLLVPVPYLTHLTLYADGLTIWPDGLLHPVPGLTHVALDVDGLAALPPNFLAHAPDLTHLWLYADRLTDLPEHWLVSQTQLEELGLYADGVTELPPGFLSAAPRLRQVYLWTACLTGVPQDFLRNTSHEVQFNREGGRWPDLPDFLWVHLWDLNWLDEMGHMHDDWRSLPASYYRGPHATITATLVNLLDQPSLVHGRVVGQVDEWEGGRFPVIDRHVDATGHVWLRLLSPSLLDLDSEEIWISADYVALADSFQLNDCQAEENLQSLSP